MVRRAEAEEYYPVYYVAPLEGNKKAIGFDLASDATGRAALNQARDTGKSVASEDIRLVQETDRQKGFLIFRPVYESGIIPDSVEARRAAFTGVVLGVFRIGDLVDRSIADGSMNRLDLYIYDLTSPDQSRLLFALPASGKSTMPTSDDGEPYYGKIASGEYHEVMLDVAGRQWAVLARPTPKYLAMHASPYPNAVLMGSMLLTLALVVCVTRSMISGARLRAMNVSLAEAQSRHVDLYENAPVMYVTVDIESGEISHCNQTLANALGYQKSELIGRPVFDLYYTDCVEGARLVHESFVNTGKTIDAELQLKRKDGTVLDVNLNASAVQDQQGSVVQSRSVYRNITRQKKAEKELKLLNEELEKRVAKRTESHARLAALVTSSSDAIIVADMDGNVTEWNQAAADLFGYPIDEVFGESLEVLYPERIRHEREQIFNKLQRGETVQGYETVRLARGGREIDVSVTVSLVTTPEGEVMGMSAILRGISARKKADEILLQQREQLRELTVAMSKSLEGERQRIAHGLHDEIGQLLTACHYRVEAIGAACESRSVTEEVNVLDELLSKADDEIRLLTFELRSHTLSDVGFIEAVEELAEHLEDRFALKVHIETGEGGGAVPPHLRATLYQAVRELLLNVVKHSGQNRAGVFIGNGGNDLHVTVEDSGKGFSISELQGKVERSGGFGLFHMREQIRHLGGKFDIRSIPGDGTSVMLEVPLAPSGPATGST